MAPKVLSFKVGLTSWYTEDPEHDQAHHENIDDQEQGQIKKISLWIEIQLEVGSSKNAIAKIERMIMTDITTSPKPSNGRSGGSNE